MLAPVNIPALKETLSEFLATASYDYVIGAAYGYKFKSPINGYMFLEALDGIEYLTSSELQNLVKNIKTFTNEYS